MSRREFSQLFAMMLTLFTGASVSTVRAGVDEATKKKKGRKIGRRMISPEDAAGCSLVIDFPAEEGWYIINPPHEDEFRRIFIDSEILSPRMHGQLIDAQAAPAEPVLCRVLGDPAAILRGAHFFAPGEYDEDCGDEEADVSGWRIHFEGNCMKRVEPDNSSWWQERLKHNPRERAFMEYWLKENDEAQKYGINSGCGLAQDLMLSTYKHEQPAGFEPWLTNRERRILATFVQWLGTNCGQGFLHEVARNGGIPEMLS